MHLSVGLYLCASVLEKRSWEVKKKKKKKKNQWKGMEKKKKMQPNPET